MQIDELTAAAAPAAVRLWEQAGLTRPWNDPVSDFHRALDGPASTVLGIGMDMDMDIGVDGDARLAGTVMVGVDGHRGWVYYLAVDTDQRGKGLGRRLMRAAEDWVLARGVPKLQLMVRSSNVDAVAFYRALGYEENDVLVLGRRLD